MNTHDTLPPGTIGRRRAATLPEQPPQLWKNVKPKKAYDAIIVGGGGHGLATAYYLAKNHGVKNIAVLEKGWLAGGNTARNTTIIRSNYLWDESAGIYEHSLKFWETLEQDLGYEMFFSQRGVLTLAHSVSDVRSKRRNFYANALNGIKGIGPAKRAEVAAVLEIARRVLAQQLAARPLFDAPQRVKDYLALHLRPLAHEAFAVLFLDTQHHLIAFEVMFHGTLTHTSVHPREIVKRALALNAGAVVLAHNHPSGVAEPSRADELVTQAVRAALQLVDVRVLDHLVVGSGSVLSFAQRGLM